MDSFRATYRIRAEPAEIDDRVEALLLEQTVELPRAAVRDPFVEKEILGRVDKISPDKTGGFVVSITFPVATTALDPAHFLTVLFGNSSLQEDVALTDVEFPPSLLSALRGPSFGIAGIRKLTGVYDRPLTCTALKPMGLGVGALAELCRVFARAGIDVIKDDHGLANHPFCPFEERVQACLAAVAEVERATGHRAVYIPNLTGTPEAVLRQLRFAEDAGAGAVMVAPMLIGLPFFWELSHGRSSLPILAHPTFAGAQRIAPETLLGTIFRLYGADAVIYPHWGGRFSYSADICRNLAERLRCAWDAIAPAMPVPAGGMAVDRTEEIIRFYGKDTMLLIGGSLYLAGDALLERSRHFVQELHRAAALTEQG
jgi:ribulose-bisphosphate carboxylase large chain